MLRSFALLVLAFIVILIGVPSLIVSSWRGDVVPPDEEIPNPTINLYVTSSKQIVSLPLEDYVKGVVAAEMPASFESAALEAQAVAARTYAARRARGLGGNGCDSHPLADLCDNPAHCQAWLPTAELQTKWGMIDYQTYWTKISQAVKATAGQILTYQGVAIDPLFHSTCGGHTEDAGAVWQMSLPYLVPVECGYCQHSPKYQADQRYSLDAFLSAVRRLDGSIAVTASEFSGSSRPLSISAKTATGRAAEVALGGKEIKATSLRYALGLNSTRFTFESDGEQIVFHVTGYGHGVGLCQYGADGMARKGYNYRQILAHYYQGTLITTLR
ncbi:MAG: stage II sporulation protein D [Bacillota bacterium]|jgi:stage II sporulation protein D